MRTLLLLSLWLAHFNVICQAAERRKRDAARLNTPVSGVLPAFADLSNMAETTRARRIQKNSDGFETIYMKRKNPFRTQMVASVLNTMGKISNDVAQQDVPIPLDSSRRHKRSLAEARQFQQPWRRASNNGEELGLQYADDAPFAFMKRARPRQNVMEEESRIPVLRSGLLQGRTSGEDEPQPRIRLARGQQLKDELYHHAKENGLIVLGPDPGVVQQPVPYDRAYALSSQRGRRYNSMTYQDDTENLPRSLENSNNNVYNFESRRQRNSLDYEFPFYEESIERTDSEATEPRHFLENNFRSYSNPGESSKESQQRQNSLDYEYPSYGYGLSVQRSALPQFRRQKQLNNFDSPSYDNFAQRARSSKRHNSNPFIADYQDQSYDNKAYAADSQLGQLNLPQDSRPLYDVESNVPDYEDNTYDTDNEKDDGRANRELLENLQQQLHNMQQVLSYYDTKFQRRRKRKRKIQTLGRGRANF